MWVLFLFYHSHKTRSFHPRLGLAVKMNSAVKQLACSAGVFLPGRNLARVRNIVVAAIFDFMTVEDSGE